MSADTDFVYSSHFPESIADLSHRSNRLGVVRSRPANVYPLARFGLTLLLYTMPALLAMRGAMMADPDVWWHLRTAESITEHHAVPRTDPFTTFGAGHPWAAYSWLFELLLLGLFRSFGLYGIVLYTSTMLLLITVAVHRLVRESLGDTPVGVMLTFLVCFSMGHLYTPRPWLFTILLFVVELRSETSLIGPYSPWRQHQPSLLRGKSVRRSSKAFSSHLPSCSHSDLNAMYGSFVSSLPLFSRATKPPRTDVVMN